MESRLTWFYLLWLVYLNFASGQESFFIKAVIDCLKDTSHIFCETVDCFLGDRTCGFAFCNFYRVSECDEVLFCHDVILIYFVVRVKLFFEVCADFFSTRRAQVIQKKLSEFFVMAHNGLIAFDAHDAEATRSDFPDLAFLW